MSAADDSKKRLRPEIEEALAAMPESELTTEPATKKARTDEHKSLFVRSLPLDATNESLAEFFSEYFPVKHATVVIDQETKKSRGFGFVTLADAEDAKQARAIFDKKNWNGRSIGVDIAKRRQRDSQTDTEPCSKPQKPEFEPTPKLIIRNLPWSIRNSEQLGHIFRSYGKVKFADLPKDRGKLKGFGFVTIRGKKNAEKALEGINGKEIDGRTITVDWAVDKNTWEQQKSKEKVAQPKIKVDEMSFEEDENDADHYSEEDSLNADLEHFMKNHMQNMEDEDEEEEEEDQTQRQHGTEMSDNSATIFIRNLPFTTTDEQLKAFFSSFGPVRYARVVKDRATDRPAGTGFVCFFEEVVARACIREAPRMQQSAAFGKKSILHDESVDPTGRYTLDGRLLSITQAVNRVEASALAEASLAKRREKDKRRLFLLSEGSISTNSPIYNLLSLPEIRMRQASTAQRKKLVQKNPALHVSLTRIALRNIPRNVGSSELKELARKAVVGFAQDVKEGIREPLSKEENARDGKDIKEKEKRRKLKGKGIVSQAKVIFESSQGSKVSEESGAGKSRGYGFIQYVSHHWALMGLRYLNGYQMDDVEEGKKKRLVAEFAIENAQVVQRRRLNEERSKQAREQMDHGKPKQHTDKNSRASDEMHYREETFRKSGHGDKKDAGRNKTRMSKKDHGNKDHKEKRPLKDKFNENDLSDGKDRIQQKVIARKRLMRKKKAVSRGRN